MRRRRSAAGAGVDNYGEIILGKGLPSSVRLSGEALLVNPWVARILDRFDRFAKDKDYQNARMGYSS